MLSAINEFQETQLGVYRETMRNSDCKELPAEVCLLRHQMRHLKFCLICIFHLYSWYHAYNDSNNNNNYYYLFYHAYNIIIIIRGIMFIIIIVIIRVSCL